MTPALHVRQSVPDQIVPDLHQSNATLDTTHSLEAVKAITTCNFDTLNPAMQNNQ
jgi:hypothetical protein